MLSIIPDTALSSQPLPTPCLLLDEARLQANCLRAAEHTARQGLHLRPHLKTLKNIDLARRCMPSPQGPATVSTLAEAEYFAAHGVTDICYAVGMVPHKLERILTLRRQGTDLSIVLDNTETLHLLAKALHVLHTPADSPLPVLLEIDCDGHRSGLSPDGDDLLAAAALLRDSQVMTLRGVLTHAGSAYDRADTAFIAALALQEGQAAVRAAQRLREDGHACPVVSVGSTPTALLGQYPAGVTEVRAGVYPFMDLTMAGLGVCGLHDVALSVLTTVIGRRQSDGSLVTDAGWMALSRDAGLAQQLPFWGYGLVCREDGTLLPGLRVSETNQEHGIISAGPCAPGDVSRQVCPSLPVGTRLRILPNHACATAACHDGYVLLRDGKTRAFLQRCRGW